MNKKIALVVDLEFWHSVELIKPHLQSSFEDKIYESVYPLLQLLDYYNYKVTFAVLGELASKYPDIVKDIYEHGHEIASHSYTHKMLDQLTCSEFEKELEQSIDVIYSIIGKKPIGFRAPSFSINNNTIWGLELLVKYGFKYDASVFPMKVGLYGQPGVPLMPFRPNLNDIRVNEKDSPIVEFPMTIYNFGVKIPIAGGFYFRIIPFSVLKKLLKTVVENRVAIFYIHPWELSISTPKCKDLSISSKLITYYGINNGFNKLNELFKIFKFNSIEKTLVDDGILKN